MVQKYVIYMITGIITCPFAFLVWQSVHAALNLSSSTSISDVFGSGLLVVRKIKVQIRVWICVLCCGFITMLVSYFLCRSYILLGIGFVCGHHFSVWKVPLHYGCSHLEMVAWGLFNRYGCWSSNRICVSYVFNVISICD
jgi:hypothetical protein